MFKKLLSGQRGSVVVLTVLAFSAIFGAAALVVDMGTLYLNKTQVSNAADAAALAGAQQLPNDPDYANNIARAYAGKNGPKSDTVTTAVANDKKSIEVKIKRDVKLQFMSMFGLPTVSVTGKAKAQVSIAASVPWIVPFVMQKPSAVDYDHEFVMCMYGANNRKIIPGINRKYWLDYMNVNIETNSWNDYVKYLEGGYSKTFEIGNDMKYYAPSSGGQPSVDAFSNRTRKDTNTDYKEAKAGDARVMLIPLVDHMLPRDTREGQKMGVVGFVAFFLEDVHKGSYGETFYAKGRFLKDFNIGSGKATSSADYDFGVRTIQLVN